MDVLKKRFICFIMIGLLSACSRSKMEPNRPSGPFPNDRNDLGVDGGGDFPTDWLEDGNDGLAGRDDGLGSGGQPGQPAPYSDPSASRRPTTDCPLIAGSQGQPGYRPAAPTHTGLDDIIPFPVGEGVRVPRTQQGPPTAPISPCEQAARGGQPPVAHPPIAAPAPAPLPQLVKVLFVVDKSFYNQRSDRDGGLRTHFVRAIYDAHKAEGWYSWGLIAFEGDDAPGDEAEFHTCQRNRSRCSGDPIFTTNHRIVENAISFIQIGLDEGLQIRYKKALDLTEKIIKEDLEQPTQGGSHYAVFFITGSSFRDGEYGYNHRDRDGQRFPADRLQRLYNKVGEIVNLTHQGYNNLVTFSTVYYGIEHRANHYLDRHGGSRNPDPPAIDPRVVLQEMAKYGNGRYISIENNAPLIPSVGYVAPPTDQPNAYAAAPPAYQPTSPYGLDVTRNPNTLPRDNTFSDTNIPVTPGFRRGWLEAQNKPESGIDWNAPSVLDHPLERKDEPLVQWRYNFRRDQNN